MHETMTKPGTKPGDDRGRHADSPWQMPLAGWKDVAIRTWRESSKDNVGIIAAGVAFYGFVALVPMLGATVLTYGLVAEPQSVIEHMQSLTKVMPADVAELIGAQLMNVVQTSGGKKGLGLLLALAIALWGARNAAGSIVTALNVAYEEEEKRGFLKVTLLSLAMTIAAVLMALLAVAASAVLAFLHQLLPGSGPVALAIWKVLTFVLLAAAAAGAVAALYRYGPSRDKARWTWITPGSAFASVGWLILTLGFGFYVSNFGNYNATYGSLGAVVVLLTWLYLSSYVLLFGAELNSELEHQTSKDTTAGASAPMGQRGAWAADNVAGGEEPAPEGGQQPDQSFNGGPATTAQKKSEGSAARDLAAARAASRAGRIAGLRKVGLVSSVISTTGLALLRRPGKAGAGAVLLVTAAGISLLKRE
jgi:membrane protein